MKEELLQLFPTPLLIVPYEQSFDKELLNYELWPQKFLMID